MPARKRGIPLPGVREDRRKWFKCWNCGFICNIERDSLNQSYEVGTIPFNDVPYGTEQFIIVEQDEIILGTRSPDSGEGNVTRYYPDVSTGCPFCGNQQWKG